MRKYLVITIDVEPDCTTNWRYSSPLTFTGVTSGIGEILQPLFNRYNAAPTYLINNVVLEDAGAINTFSSLPGKFELGTHLHPEFIEPDKKFSDYSGKKGEANCCFYPPDIEFEKIRSITELFKSAFGYSPVSFRAGRFSAGDNTIRSLVKLGYKVDTSVTPNMRWDDKTRERAVDFRAQSNQPYFVNAEIRKPSAKQTLLEVPVSIARKKLSPVDYLKYVRRNKRVPYKGSKPVWLRPVFSSVHDFRYVMDSIATGHRNEPHLVYNMMFHNVEVMPGLSPYTKTDDDRHAYLHSLEWLLDYCQKTEVECVTLSSLYDIFRDEK